MKLVINRAQWDAGLAEGCLLHDSDSRQQCCLGHLCSAFGLTDEEILDVEVPSVIEKYDLPNLPVPAKLFQVTFSHINSTITSSDLERQTWEDIFARINDSAVVPREPGGTREQWIAEGFKQVLGIEVEFVGEYE